MRMSYFLTYRDGTKRVRVGRPLNANDRTAGEADHGEKLFHDGGRRPLSNPGRHDVSGPSRRTVLRGGSAPTASGLLAPLSAVGGAAALSRMCLQQYVRRPIAGFQAFRCRAADLVVVPKGYTAQALAPWVTQQGLSGEDHAFKDDGSNTAAQQEPRITAVVATTASLSPKKAPERPAGDQPRVR